MTERPEHFFLLTLVDLGYVGTDARFFSLRPQVLELGYAFLSALTLPQVAEPHLERLAVAVREASSVSVLDDDSIVYVARRATSRIMNVTISVGTRFPAYATTMGRVLLADVRPAELDAYLDRADLCPLTRRTITDADTLRGVLSTVPAQGWALVDQELEEGLRAVAAPIRDRSGRVAAAVNLSTHASRTTLEGMGRDLLPELLATARRIEADLRLAGASAGHAAGHAVTALARSRRHA